MKRLLCPGLIDSNQALQNELNALRDMYISFQQQIDALSDKHMLFQTAERSLVSTDKKRLLLAFSGVHTTLLCVASDATIDTEQSCCCPLLFVEYA